MKFQIVYPTGFNTSARYLVGRREDGSPIYRFNTTNPPRVYTESERVMQRVMLSSVIGAFMSDFR